MADSVGVGCVKNNADRFLTILTRKAEREKPHEEGENCGRAALAELFYEVKTAETRIIVERVVADVDEIVRLVRFPGWQET